MLTWSLAFLLGMVVPWTLRDKVKERERYERVCREWESMLPDPEHPERASIIEELGVCRIVAALDHIVRFAADPDPGVRRSVAVALGEIGGPEAQRTLLSMVDDHDGIVRGAVARALRKVERSS